MSDDLLHRKVGLGIKANKQVISRRLSTDLYMKLALANGEVYFTGYESLQGIWYTKQGQCLEYKAARLETGDGDAGRSAILLKIRREWQSYCFKAFDEKEIPSMSILDFAVIPLQKPRRARVDEKNQNEGRRTFNLFTNKNLSCNGVEVRFNPKEEDDVSWQLQLLGHPKHIHLLNVWRSQDPEVGDYATWPLEMSFAGILKSGETSTMSGEVLPIVLKLDNEHELYILTSDPHEEDPESNVTGVIPMLDRKVGGRAAYPITTRPIQPNWL